MKKKQGPIEIYGYFCPICRKPITQKKGGQRRRTCSDACRQALHRERKGKKSMRSKRRGKTIDKRRAMPLTERRFDPEPKPILELGHTRRVYECQLCGQPYLVEGQHGSMKVRFCSYHCKRRADTVWRNFSKGRYKALGQGGVDSRVEKRLALGKVSPLCLHCGKPFAPNTTPEGDKTRGRPRKYCSDGCRWANYEKRWKRKNGRARVHRFHECLNCGKRFDRTRSDGKRQKRFCSKTCNGNYRTRVLRFRWKTMWEYTRKNKWLESFKKGSSGHGFATRTAPKNRKPTARKLKSLMGDANNADGTQELLQK